MNKRWAHRIALATYAFLSCAGFTSPTRAAQVTEAAPLSGEIPLRGNAPRAGTTEKWIPFSGERRLIDVTEPTLTAILPSKDKATGAAVIVAPGGGFMWLAIDKEGWAAAHWLADHGIAAFVLKYRVRPSAQFVGAPPGVSGNRPALNAATIKIYPPALEDANAALRYVRAHARQYSLASDRIGMMGFSAGAFLTVSLATAPGTDQRPSFVASIYGPMGGTDVPSDAPPMFTAVAADDGTTPPGDLALVQAWRSARRPVELHLYEAGGHGFGVPGVAGTTTTAMMDEFFLWMTSRGLLTAQTGKR